MKKLFLVGFAALFAGSGTAHAEPHEIELQDGHLLAADINNVEGSKHSVLLLHQCNRDQRMWKPVVAKLNAMGVSTMTVDFRGFGESASDDFNASVDYQKAVSSFRDDLKAIDAYWRHHSAADSRGVGGASCGGAMASILAGANEDVRALALFSPSLREFWFPESYWAPLNARTELPVLGIAGVGDDNAIRSVERVIMKSASPNSEYIRYNNALHGEPLFEHDTNLSTKIAVWINETLKD